MHFRFATNWIEKCIGDTVTEWKKSDPGSSTPKCLSILFSIQLRQLHKHVTLLLTRFCWSNLHLIYYILPGTFRGIKFKFQIKSVYIERKTISMYAYKFLEWVLWKKVIISWIWTIERHLWVDVIDRLFKLMFFQNVGKRFSTFTRFHHN